jgi:hypothetical protein
MSAVLMGDLGAFSIGVLPMMNSALGPSIAYQANSLVSNLRANGLSQDKAALAAADVKGAVDQIGMVQRGPANKAAITAALQERISADVAAGKLSADDAAAVFKTFEEMDPAKQNGGPSQKGPPPSADGAGPALTKEEVDAQIAQLGTANSERLETLKKISSNFAAADTNSDGKVSRDEANAYLQSTGDSTGRPPQAEGAGGPPPKGGAGGPPPKGGVGAGGGGQDSSNKTVLSETTTVSGSLQTTTTLYTDGTSETKTQTVTAAATNSDTYSKTAITDLLKTSATPDSSASMVQNYLSSFKPGSLFDILVQ